MFMEYSFHFVAEEHWVVMSLTTLILQPEPDLALELVELRKYGYDRNLGNPENQSRHL
jgi:hypothetical protein